MGLARPDGLGAGRGSRPAPGRLSQGREVRIPAKEIEEKGPGKTSLMPAGVVGHLSFGERAALLAFLGDRKAQERLRGRQT